MPRDKASTYNVVCFRNAFRFSAAASFLNYLSQIWFALKLCRGPLAIYLFLRALQRLQQTAIRAQAIIKELQERVRELDADSLTDLLWGIAQDPHFRPAGSSAG